VSWSGTTRSGASVLAPAMTSTSKENILMTSNYHNKRYERCFMCHGYINLDKDSHAIVGIGVHTQYLHTGLCFKHAKHAGHRMIVLTEVHHGS
jgi:hypothetical protein